MKLSSFEGDLAVLERRGPADADVHAATGDSRAVAPGTLFAAIPGTRVDGHRFLAGAVAAGASALVVQRWTDDVPDDRPALRVADPRRALGAAAAALHGHPSRDLLVLAVTGTNGKTSTVAILRHLLEAAGYRAGAIGTTGVTWTGAAGPVALEATHTTPDGPAMQALFARMRDDGVQAVAMELSSHALHQGRAAALDLDVAGWTNLSRDHLDYHADLADYEAAKALILDEVLAGSPSRRGAALVVDHAAVARHVTDDTLTVSTRVDSDAAVRPTATPRFGLDGITAPVTTPDGDFTLRSPLIGAHNLENLLLAVAMGLQAGIALPVLVDALATAPAAPGRMERVERADGRGPLVLVDYAHTPDAVEQALRSVLPFVPGAIVTVLGCGGDRDPGKRPLMAAAAWAGSDAVVLTSDNPRSEDPEVILDQMLPGVPDVTAAASLTPDTPLARITSRREAIRAAIAAAGPGDLVLIAGKGHEMTQEFDGKKEPFDDRTEAQKALDGFHAPSNEPPAGFNKHGRIVQRFPRPRQPQPGYATGTDDGPPTLEFSD